MAFIAFGQEAVPRYHVVQKLTLGGEGGWDYLTTDSATRRLYVSRGSHVMVVDLNAGKLVGDIPDALGVHGIALAPELNRGFTSNGRANTVTIFDLKTLKTAGQVKTGANPDAIVYDPPSKRVFTFNGRSHDATAFAAATGEVEGTIALGGKPEFAVSDGQGAVYVNIEDTAEVVEIDTAKLVVTRRFPLKPCEEPTGLALDPAQRRVFSACHNQIMTVLDLAAGKVIASAPIGQGVDGAGFDPSAKLAFSSNGGDGTLTVVRESAPGKYEAAETVTTQRSARTMTIDPKTHSIYLPAAEPGVKDSFVVLVVGK